MLTSKNTGLQVAVAIGVMGEGGSGLVLVLERWRGSDHHGAGVRAPGARAGGNTTLILERGQLTRQGLQLGLQLALVTSRGSTF